MFTTHTKVIRYWGDAENNNSYISGPESAK